MQQSLLVGDIAQNIYQRLDDAKTKLEREGRSVVNLSIGTPDLPPPQHVLDAICEAALNPKNYKYSLFDTPQLVHAVCEWYARRYGVSLLPENITSIYGSQEGLSHIFHVICNPGDTVIVPTPGYPIFSFAPSLAGAEIYSPVLVQENNFLIDFDVIPKTVAQRAKAILVSYPSNPLCVTAPEEFYEKLIAFAKKYDIIVLHDNAYSDLVHAGGSAKSFLAYPGAMDVGIEFNSLSKSYNLTGLRISFAIGNVKLIAAFVKLRSQIDYGLSYIDQAAGVAALTGPQDIVCANRKAYSIRADIFSKAMHTIGWKFKEPQATMFAWLPVPMFAKGMDDEEFCFTLLKRAGVLCTPGSAYGRGGEGWLRFALTQTEDVLLEAVNRIASVASDM